MKAQAMRLAAWSTFLFRTIRAATVLLMGYIALGWCANGVYGHAQDGWMFAVAMALLAGCGALICWSACDVRRMAERFAAGEILYVEPLNRLMGSLALSAALCAGVLVWEGATARDWQGWLLLAVLILLTALSAVQLLRWQRYHGRDCRGNGEMPEELPGNQGGIDL